LDKWFKIENKKVYMKNGKNGIIRFLGAEAVSDEEKHLHTS